MHYCILSQNAQCFFSRDKCLQSFSQAAYRPQKNSNRTIWQLVCCLTGAAVCLGEIKLKSQDLLESESGFDLKEHLQTHFKTFDHLWSFCTETLKHPNDVIKNKTHLWVKFHWVSNLSFSLLDSCMLYCFLTTSTAGYLINCTHSVTNTQRTQVSITIK